MSAQLLVQFPDGSHATCEQATAWQTFVAESEPLAWCEARGFDMLRVVAVRHHARVLGATVAHDRPLSERDALDILRAHGGVRARTIARSRIPRREPWFMGLHAAGMIGDRDVATFLSQATRVPTINLGEFEVASDVIALVSRVLCERHRVLPVSRAGQSLIVAMVDPTDQTALAALRDGTGLAIEPVIAADVDIAAAIARYY